MTHTYALLPVPRAVYDLIREKLESAGYANQIRGDKSDADMVMDGLALVPDVAEPDLRGTVVYPHPITEWIICPTCRGDGGADEDCQTCHRRGKICIAVPPP
jgi:hypothetical protein